MSAWRRPRQGHRRFCGSEGSKQPNLIFARKPSSGHLERIAGYRTRIDGKDHRLLRGDLHRHTELSWDEGGANDGSLDDYYRYMLDAASLDFGANTEHQGGAWPYWWWYSQKMSDMYHLPGAYVSLFAHERSASYP